MRSEAAPAKSDAMPQVTLETATRLATAARLVPRSRAMSSRNGETATPFPVTRKVAKQSASSIRRRPATPGSSTSPAPGSADSILLMPPSELPSPASIARRGSVDIDVW